MFLCVYSTITNEEKIMKKKTKEYTDQQLGYFQAMSDMDEFFQEIDKAIGRDPEEVDVITDHLPDPVTDEEAEYWEMKAEIHNGI